MRCEHQGITSLPPQLLLKATVRQLILTGNELDSLPPELFSSLRELRQLRVGHNKLRHLPAEVQLLPHLQHLDLQHNQLQDVPAALCKCARLKVVNLNGNPLRGWLQEVWQQPEGVSAEAGSSSSSSRGTQEAAALQLQLKANTTALLDHLLQEQVRVLGMVHYGRGRQGVSVDNVVEAALLGQAWHGSQVQHTCSAGPTRSFVSCMETPQRNVTGPYPYPRGRAPQYRLSPTINAATNGQCVFLRLAPLSAGRWYGAAGAAGSAAGAARGEQGAAEEAAACC